MLLLPHSHRTEVKLKKFFFLQPPPQMQAAGRGGVLHVGWDACSLAARPQHACADGQSELSKTKIAEI